MPARVVVVLNQPAAADQTVLVLKRAGYDALAIHDSMVALTALERARNVELLVTSAEFQGAPQPNGVALACMTQSKRPELKVIFVGPAHLAHYMDGLGQFLPEPIRAPQIVEAVRKMLPREEWGTLPAVPVQDAADAIVAAMRQTYR